MVERIGRGRVLMRRGLPLERIEQGEPFAVDSAAARRSGQVRLRDSTSHCRAGEIQRLNSAAGKPARATHRTHARTATREQLRFRSILRPGGWLGSSQRSQWRCWKSGTSESVQRNGGRGTTAAVAVGGEGVQTLVGRRQHVSSRALSSPPPPATSDLLYFIASSGQQAGTKIFELERNAPGQTSKKLPRLRRLVPHTENTIRFPRLDAGPATEPVHGRLPRGGGVTVTIVPLTNNRDAARLRAGFSLQPSLSRPHRTLRVV